MDAKKLIEDAFNAGYEEAQAARLISQDKAMQEYWKSIENDVVIEMADFAIKILKSSGQKARKSAAKQ